MAARESRQPRALNPRLPSAMSEKGGRYPTATGAGFSIGTPTIEPHSVHDPS